MKILDRLTGSSTGAAAGDVPVVRGEASSFQARMKRLSPVRSSSWRQLLRLNRGAQVDPLIGPPTPPPGFSIADPASERNLLRRLLDNQDEQPPTPEASTGWDERKQAVERMLSLLWEQQRAHDEFSARSVSAEAKWR